MNPRPALQIAAALLSGIVFSSSAQAQSWDFDLRGFCNQSGSQRLQPTQVSPNVQVFSCWNIGVPITQGLLGFDFVTSGSFCEGIDGRVDVKVPTTSEELGTWAVQQIQGLITSGNPLPFGPCPPTSITDFGRMTGNPSLFAFSIGGLFGGAPIITRKVESEMTWDDQLMIWSASARTISLRIGTSANITAAESFGSATTEARGEVSVTGTVGSGSVSIGPIRAVSVTTIPTQRNANLNDLIQIPLQAGTNVINIQLSALAEVEVTAQGAGLIAGSATAGITFPNGISVGPFLDDAGGPLPPGVMIQSMRNDILYEDTTMSDRYLKMGFGTPGTNGIPELTGSGPFVNGQRIDLEVTGGQPNAAGVIAVGGDVQITRLLDGWIVPDLLTGLVVPTVLDAQGELTQRVRVPANLPPATEFYFQVWVADSGSTNGVLAATNGLAARTAP